MERIAKIKVRRVTKSMKNQLGRQVETNFSVKLACQSESWSEEGQVDVNLEAKRHQVGAQRGFGVAQSLGGGPKRLQDSPKGHGPHWECCGSAATVLQGVYVTGVLGSP